MSDSESEVESFYSEDESFVVTGEEIEEKLVEIENILPNRLPSDRDAQTFGDYNMEDEGASVPVFCPTRESCVHLPDVRTWDYLRKFLTPMDFFKHFFTMDLVAQICKYSNDYAAAHGPEKPTLYSAWPEAARSFVSVATPTSFEDKNIALER